MWCSWSPDHLQTGSKNLPWTANSEWFHLDLICCCFCFPQNCLFFNDRWKAFETMTLKTHEKIWMLDSLANINTGFLEHSRGPRLIFKMWDGPMYAKNWVLSLHIIVKSSEWPSQITSEVNCYLETTRNLVTSKLYVTPRIPVNFELYLFPWHLQSAWHIVGPH